MIFCYEKYMKNILGTGAGSTLEPDSLFPNVDPDRPLRGKVDPDPLFPNVDPAQDPDPDPRPNEMDPKRCFLSFCYIDTVICFFSVLTMMILLLLF